MCLTAQGRLGLCEYIFLGYVLEYEGKGWGIILYLSIVKHPLWSVNLDNSGVFDEYKASKRRLPLVSHP